MRRSEFGSVQGMLARALVVLSGCASGTGGLAAAQEYCVTCTGPSATYVCAIEGLSAQAAAGIQGQVLCIKQLATAGRHEQCWIDRHASTVCHGPLRTASPAAGDEGVAPPATPRQAPPAGTTPNAAQDAIQPATAPGGAATDPAPGGPAQWSVLKKTGDNIGKAISKSWSCVTSLFSNC